MNLMIYCICIYWCLSFLFAEPETGLSKGETEYMEQYKEEFIEFMPAHFTRSLEMLSNA